MTDPRDRDEAESERLYVVVLNDEEQHSIWPADRPPPPGWHTVGEPQSRERCLAHIDQAWTDMRPASLRRFLAERSNDGA